MFAPTLPLRLSHLMVRALIPLNLLFGGSIAALLIASLLAEGPIMGALGATAAADSNLFFGMRLIMVLGICSVPLAHVVLTRLRAVIATTSRGSPFDPLNAKRLRAMAAALLGVELLHLMGGLVATAASSRAEPLDIDWRFSFAGWLAVLLLFALSEAFEHGAQIENDVRGTV